MFNIFKSEEYIYIVRQCLLFMAVTIDCFIGGAGITYSATLLPQLQNETSLLKITDNEGTWIASITILGVLPGTVTGGVLVELIGRKWSYALVSLSNVASWLLIANSNEYWQLLLGKGLQGFTMGCGYAPLYCFVSEVATVEYRSLLLNMINIGWNFGILFVDLVGTYCAWQLSAYILVIVSIIYFLIFLYVQNTHVWYLNRNRLKDAEVAFFWYRDRSKNDNVNEFNNLIEQSKLRKSISFTETRKECAKREFLMPFGIVSWFFMTVIFSGGVGIMLYSVTIMQNLVSIDEYLTTVIIDILRILSSFVVIFLLKYLRIRLIVNACSLLCVISLLVLSAGIFWEDSWSGLSWIILISVLSYMFFYNLGYVNIANISMGELFTGITKSVGPAFATLFWYSMYFGYAQIVPTMFSRLGNLWTFLLFALCNIIGGIGLFFILPETKNVSNEDIREQFKKPKTILNPI